MSQPPFEQIGNLRIGTVDFVSPDRIEVALDITAPESVALNTGIPRPFPRVNDYLLIPVDESFLTGQVEWLTVEDSSFPKRSGMRDFGLIDLPYPLRKLRLNPLGTLRIQRGSDSFIFGRGADALPSVGESVLLPTDDQLRAIVESGKENRIKVGSSLIAGNANVYVDPNRLFGRHLAVLGNTGSGKSCSVAGLIRWSLEQAHSLASSTPNARFVVLDPNGEYSRAFSDMQSGHVRNFRSDPGDGELPLRVPLWFWNVAEWTSFTRASTQAQQPLLRRALREVKAGQTSYAERPSEKVPTLRRYLLSRLIAISYALRSGEIQSNESRFGFRLAAMSEDLKVRQLDFPEVGLDRIISVTEQVLGKTYNSFVNDAGETVEYYRAFSEQQIIEIISAVENALLFTGGVANDEGIGEDLPLPFKGSDLADHLEMLAYEENVIQYVEFLIARIRTFLLDPNMKAVFQDTEGVTLEGWLDEYIGNDREESVVSVVDLSLLPTEVVHVATSVIARMIFEAQQRYVKIHGKALPTVLVMEEAHTFVKRYRYNVENVDAAIACCQVFERIAREGRKFGLGLVLSSQRPSELSPAVLSQCNTFLLHQLSNDRDQELVHHLVPDNLRGLLRELPSLPSQSAILLGWASELPVLVKMNDLPRSQQPRSEDPEFWKVWTREEIREINWDAVVQEWTGLAKTETENQAGTEELEYSEVEEDEDDLPW